MSNAQAVGSAAGVTDLCNTPANEQPTQPTTLPSTWPYYTYPTPQGTEGADGIPIDLVRASASIADLANHNVAGCADLAEQGIAQDAVVGMTFSPDAGNVAGKLPDGTTVVDPVPPGTAIDFSQGTVATASDIAYRVFCDLNNTDGLRITTWDGLYAAEEAQGDITSTYPGPNPDQPLVLWGVKNNSGTGATWFTFSDCGTTTGVIPSGHLITENNAEQISQYAAANDCGGAMGTSAYTTAVEQCVAQEVADSIFFMSYGYTSTHPYTASVTIPTPAVGSNPNYIDNASNYVLQGTNSTIGTVPVDGTVLGQPGAVTGDPRANNAGAVQTGRDLWLDYLTDHVRASAASFVNWVCDLNDHIAPKGVDVTTGQTFDGEITNDITAWGWGRISCDGESTPGKTSTYTAAIPTNAGVTSGGVEVGPVIDPGPPNNE